jgi:hypothetical protein
MAKRSGNKGSRSERRAGRQRATRARDHGLPARVEPESRRVRASTPEPGSAQGADRSSDAPPALLAKPQAGIPTLVKVVGGALAVLAAAYALSRFRDESVTTATPEPAGSAAAAAAGPEAAPSEALLEPSAAPRAKAVPDPLLVQPVLPSIAAPSVAVPTAASVPKPSVAPRPAVVIPKPAPLPAPAVAAPKPALAPAAPLPAPAAPKPADNPY